MPIKLKKTDIQNDLDDPVEGYVILGFDETGRLVSKDSEGTYGTIVPIVPTGEFDNIRTSYLTVGSRIPPTFDEDSYGNRSVGIGIGLVIDKENSLAQGINLDVTGENSHAQGSNLNVSGNNSFIGGLGLPGDRTNVTGQSSFAFFRTNIGSLNTGIFSDDSAILGGINHRISSGSGSVILGGANNTVTGSNIIILGGSSVNANNPNSVYAPKLILSENTESSAPNGTLRYTGSDIQARLSDSWVSLTDTGVVGVTSVSAGNGMTFTTITNTGSVTLGTPSSITTSSTNSVTTNSHTHQINGFLALSGGTMTNELNSKRIISDQGFINPYLNASVANPLILDARTNLNYVINRNTSFTLRYTNLMNGMFGSFILYTITSISITLGTMEPYSSETTGSVSVYTTGNFTALSSGRYVITWTYVHTTPNPRSMYINITQYS